MTAPYYAGAAAAAAAARADRLDRMAASAEAAGRHVDAELDRIAAAAARRTAARWSAVDAGEVPA